MDYIMKLLFYMLLPFIAVAKPDNHTSQPPHRPGYFTSSSTPGPMDPIAPNTDMLGFSVGDLAGLAPIAISMFCFNSAPKLTMVTLTSLLLYILSMRHKNRQIESSEPIIK
jgi:hypothetical protein